MSGTSLAAIVGDHFTVLELVFRLVLAGVIGAVVGLEREVSNRPAGIRTNMLVSMGSCLMMIVSIYMVEAYQTGDPARIAAQVVSGIGFLGAGTIIVKGFDVKGLTTAATLWVNAGIGLAIGAGYYMAGLVAGTLVFLVLTVLGHVDFRITGRSVSELVVYTRSGLETFSQVTSLLKEQGADIKTCQLDSKQGKSGHATIYLEVVMPAELVQEKLVTLFEPIDEIKRVVYQGREILVK